MYIHKFLAYTKSFTPFLFWVLLVIITKALLMEHAASLPGFPHMDKMIHAMLFFILTLTGSLAYTAYLKWLYTGLIAYGAITEVMQGMLTITRFASVFDWLADIAGILIAAILINLLFNTTQTKDHNAN